MILGASYDTPEDNRKFAEKFEFNFDLICDVDKSIAKAYGAFDAAKPDYAKRAAFIIGKDGKVTHAWEKVPAAEFPEQALAAVCGQAAGGKA